MARILIASQAPGAKAIEHLNLFASCVSCDGEVEWESYQHELGLLRLNSSVASVMTCWRSTPSWR